MFLEKEVGGSGPHNDDMTRNIYSGPDLSVKSDVTLTVTTHQGQDGEAHYIVSYDAGTISSGRHASQIKQFMPILWSFCQ